jgi:predicted metal-dependent phosphoesterase TrpH
LHLDLHLHTTCSDGALAPEALALAARHGGLDAIAVTDHDTTAGVGPARRAAGDRGPLVIAGVELTCGLDGADVHLLGYGVDPGHPALQAVTDRLAVLRKERIAAIVERLRALGVAIAVADVRVPEGNASIGRPHVAEALIRLGAVRHFQEAFARFLADGGPAYVPARGPGVADGIAAVAQAGGCSVWAHPELADAARFSRLRDMGLDGIEALRPSLASVASSALESAAHEAGLFVTGGSDWHGGNPPLGSWYVTDRHVRVLLDRLGIVPN